MHKVSAFDIPVVLFIYKRPELTSELVEVLRTIGPQKIFVFADGPKNKEEEVLCIAARNVIKNIDWTHNVFTDYKEHNVGCTNRIVSGLNEAFSRVDRAIILEDDCIPSVSFFHYCKDQLNYYDKNDEVMHINGINLLYNKMKFKNNGPDYFFSKFSIPSWGWATWKRAWEKFNPALDTWQRHKELLFINMQQKNFKVWTDVIKFVELNNITWDLPWNIDIWKNRGLVIIPCKNLVTYKGHNATATTTLNTKSDYSNITAQQLDLPIVHPEAIQIWEYEPEYEDEIINLMQEEINFRNGSLK